MIFCAGLLIGASAEITAASESSIAETDEIYEALQEHVSKTVS